MSFLSPIISKATITLRYEAKLFDAVKWSSQVQYNCDTRICLVQ